VRLDLRPFVVVLLLAGCATPPVVAGRPTTPGSPSVPAMKPVIEQYELIAPASRTAFLASLARIDHRLAADPTRQLRRAVVTCDELYAGKPAAVRLKNVGVRYNAPRKAKRIYPAILKWICSSKALRSRHDGMAVAGPKPKSNGMATPPTIPNPLPAMANPAPIRPGSHCGPAGARGIAGGHVYICKGLRWRR
jgi:hypothetical protein